MRTLIALVVATCFSGTAFAQQPNHDPELKKLAIYVGQWKYEGEYLPGPIGPASKVTGEAMSKMILKERFLEWRWTEQVNSVETKGFEILSYDPINKNYASSIYGDDGSSCSGAYVIDGNTSKFSGKLTVMGKQYLYKVAEVFTVDLLSFAQKAEISIDGKTWTLYFRAQFTKVNPTTKK